jgi:hypothetical protein
MIKFVHKKHIKNAKPVGKIVIYYSLSDIVLGGLLVSLTIFFTSFYIKASFPNRSSSAVASGMTNTIQKTNNNLKK